jgi:hypothetical protein
MKKEEEKSKPDHAILNFLAKRQEQASQLRFWTKVGHELPKVREFTTSQGLAALK